MRRLIALIMLITSPAYAAEVTLDVNDAWVRATNGNQKNTAVYVSLINDTGKELFLTGASTPVAERTELHTYKTHKNGMMEMVQLKQVRMGPGQFIDFAPKGHHIMLIGVTQPLDPGLEIPVQLQFKGGEFQNIRAIVQPVSYTGITNESQGESVEMQLVPPLPMPHQTQQGQ